MKPVIRSEQIQCRFTPEEKAAIQRAAAADNRTVSQWVALAVRKVLEGIGK
jgi:uncharacterized protein (DUF1778 family)